MQRGTESYGEPWRARERYGYIFFYTITVFPLRCFGELSTATESYGEPLVENFILYFNMTRQELRRATESYRELRELRRAMV